MPSKTGSWELPLIDDKLQVSPRQGRVVSKSPLGRDTSWLEEPVTDSVAPDKILRDSDIKEPAVDAVPPDQMVRTSTTVTRARGVPPVGRMMSRATSLSRRVERLPGCPG